MESFFDKKEYKISFSKCLDEGMDICWIECYDAKIISLINEKEIVAEANFYVMDNTKCEYRGICWEDIYFDVDEISADATNNCEDLFKYLIDLNDVRKWIYIYTFKVNENYRGKKIGTNFFKEILKKVKYREKLDVISLTPSSLTPIYITEDIKSPKILKEDKIAREFWKSCGFSKFRRRTYVYNVEELKKNNIL